MGNPPFSKHDEQDCCQRFSSFFRLFCFASSDQSILFQSILVYLNAFRQVSLLQRIWRGGTKMIAIKVIAYCSVFKHLSTRGWTNRKLCIALAPHWINSKGVFILTKTKPGYFYSSSWKNKT